VNPFRYRGYYYDWETRYYYLQTRYYDPETGRFLNSDSTEYLDPETIHGCNLYAYGLNNPVMYTDETGQIAITTIMTILTIVTSVIIGGISGYVDAVEKGEDIATGIISGIVSSGLLAVASTLTLGGAVILSLGAGAASYAIHILGNEKDFSVEDMLASVVTTTVQGVASFGLTAYCGGKNLSVIETLGVKIIESPMNMMIGVLSDALQGEETTGSLIIDLLGGFIPY